MNISDNQRKNFSTKFVIPEDTTECWIWTGATLVPGPRGTSYPYGMFGVGTKGSGGGRMQLAHRVAYFLANGPITPGLCIMHTCDNPRCVNPAHLVAGTMAENMADMRSKGRDGYSVAMRNPDSKAGQRWAKKPCIHCDFAMNDLNMIRHLRVCKKNPDNL